MDNPKSFSDREFGPEVEVAVQILKHYAMLHIFGSTPIGWAWFLFKCHRSVKRAYRNR